MAWVVGGFEFADDWFIESGEGAPVDVLFGVAGSVFAEGEEFVGEAATGLCLGDFPAVLGARVLALGGQGDGDCAGEDGDGSGFAVAGADASEDADGVLAHEGDRGQAEVAAAQRHELHVDGFGFAGHEVEVIAIGFEVGAVAFAEPCPAVVDESAVEGVAAVFVWFWGMDEFFFVWDGRGGAFEDAEVAEWAFAVIG